MVKYHVTTFERTMDGETITVPRPWLSRHSLAAVVRQIDRLGYVPGACSMTGLTIVETQIISEALEA